MIGANNEVIAEALFKVLQGVNGIGAGQFDFTTFSRDTRIWSDVDPSSLPAAFLLYFGERISQDQTSTFGSRIYTLHFLFLAYFQTSPQSSLEGERIAFSIKQTIDSLLGTPGQPQTLNQCPGVINAWIEGDIVLDTGIIDQPMVLRIPIEVLAGM